MAKVLSAIKNLTSKSYDEFFDSAKVLERLPLETYIISYKCKRIIVAPPREYILLVKIHRVSLISHKQNRFQIRKCTF